MMRGRRTKITFCDLISPYLITRQEVDSRTGKTLGSQCSSQGHTVVAGTLEKISINKLTGVFVIPAGSMMSDG